MLISFLLSMFYACLLHLSFKYKFSVRCYFRRERDVSSFADHWENLTAVASTVELDRGDLHFLHSIKVHGMYCVVLCWTTPPSSIPSLATPKTLTLPVLIGVPFPQSHSYSIIFTLKYVMPQFLYWVLYGSPLNCHLCMYGVGLWCGRGEETHGNE